MSLSLEELGWNADFEKAFKPFYKKHWIPGRLIRDNKISYGAILEGGEEWEVFMSGKVYHAAEANAELPAVGDWVAVDPGSDDDEPMIRARLERQTCFSRKVPGKSTEEQVIAANVDTVFVVTDAGTDFNLRRMERYFTLIARSKAQPVVLVNRSDLYAEEENEAAARAIQKLNPHADIHITSAIHENGVEIIRSHLKPGKTVTLVGSSGVGKSSIVNQLLGEEWQVTGEVNEVSGKGRHTTTAREIVILPEGGLLIDNPGIREVHLWTDEQTLYEQFADIEEISRECKFHDCKHGSDKGCAVREAVDSGRLDWMRYQGYLRLDDEIHELKSKRKKRQMTFERRNKRELRKIVRNPADREQMRKELRPSSGGKVEEFED
ncbi:MAG: ribosome small subunit-dependent GTPase A [Verrucomicrobiales bacterium]|nr:ribosome small subunit-dependent GTPase A [Verrucomicrobiales bacterium]